jgi:hypothetical protein
MGDPKDPAEPVEVCGYLCAAADYVVLGRLSTDPVEVEWCEEYDAADLPLAPGAPPEPDPAVRP